MEMKDVNKTQTTNDPRWDPPSQFVDVPFATHSDAIANQVSVIVMHNSDMKGVPRYNLPTEPPYKT